VLKAAEPRLRKALITNCNKELVNYISECVLNVLNGNIKLPGCNKRKLKNKPALRNFSESTSLSGKKRLMIQSGEFLQHLLAAILPTIASLISTRA